MVAVSIFGALTGMPILIWLTLEPFGVRFGSIAFLVLSVGQLAGILGMVLLSINLIISARLRLYERFLPGFNVLYGYHHTIGGLALVLLLIHPVALAFSAVGGSFSQILFLFLPSQELSVLFGQLALGLLLVLLIITLYIKLPYEWWRLSHMLLGIPLLLASMHVFLIPSDVARSLGLKYFLLGLAIIGLVSYFYRTVLGHWLIKRYNYVIGSVRNLGEITEITAKPVGVAIPFEPGQYAFIKIKGLGFSFETHPFSFSASPTATGEVRFSAKNLGDYTKDLKKIKEGARMTLEGGYGTFTIRNIKKARQVWVAGGIGVTPFLSMAGDMGGEQTEVFYCVNDWSEAVYAEELRELARKNSNLRVQVWNSRERGRITGRDIAKQVTDISARDILLCGPVSMMDALQDQLRTLGVNPASIHTEAFAIR